MSKNTKILIYFVTEDWYFVSHRLELALSAIDDGFDVYLVTNSGDDIYIIRNAPVPAGSSLEIISGSKIIMDI